MYVALSLPLQSLRELTKLQEESDISLHLAGSIRIIEKGNLDRYKEAQQHVSMASLYDDPEFPTEMISPEEIMARHPLVNIDEVSLYLYFWM
jgi:dimethylglycine dehydrogenase